MTTQAAIDTQPEAVVADALPTPLGPVADAVPPASPDAAAAPAPFSLDISSILALLPDDDALDDWFLRFTADNEHLGYQFEIDRDGRLIGMASEGLNGVVRSGNTYYDLATWANSGASGIVLTGNALVRMFGSSRRAADAGWVAPEQLAGMTSEQRHRGLPFAPRFVVEMRSRSNSLEDQQDKMEEWIAYGVALGWLIDPFLRQVHIYRPGTAPEVLDDPETVNGEPELPGFVFEVRARIFDLT